HQRHGVRRVRGLSLEPLQPRFHGDAVRAFLLARRRARALSLRAQWLSRRSHRLDSVLSRRYARLLAEPGAANGDAPDRRAPTPLTNPRCQQSRKNPACFPLPKEEREVTYPCFDLRLRAAKFRAKDIGDRYVRPHLRRYVVRSRSDACARRCR